MEIYENPPGDLCFIRHLAEESSRIRSHLDAAVTAKDSSSMSLLLFKDTETDKTTGRGRDNCARRGPGYWQEPFEVP
jgi:hypothetical protein